LEFNVPFHHKHGYIRDERSGMKSYPYPVKEKEIKQLIEFRQCTDTAFEWKCNFHVSPGSTGAQVIWGGI